MMSSTGSSSSSPSSRFLSSPVSGFCHSTAAVRFHSPTYSSLYFRRWSTLAMLLVERLSRIPSRVTLIAYCHHSRACSGLSGRTSGRYLRYFIDCA